MNPSAEKLTEYLEALRKQASGELYRDDYTRILYSTDASLYQVMPLAVFIPHSSDDVHAAVELAAQYQAPLLPRTAGSSLAGQAVNEAVVIDMSRRLDRILEINPEEKWVRVQPGVVLDHLNAELRSYGLKFGPDPASSNRAALGGIVANNSTGAHSILYGMTADHVLECRGFLSDGTPFHFQPLSEAQLAFQQNQPGLIGDIHRGVAELVRAQAEVIRAGTPHHWRRCGGYNLDRFIDRGATFLWPQDERFNLAKLVCGSEGTLAVMSEIKLNVVELPRQSALALVHFDDLYEALSAVPLILETDPSAIELLDHLGLSKCREVPEYARLLKTFMEGDPHCILITEYYGDTEQELKERVEKLRRRLRSNKVPAHIVPALHPELQQNVWTVRKVGLGLLMSVKGDFKPVPFIEDAAAPPEHLAEYISRIESFCNDLGVRVAYYAHASAGCLHVRPLMNTKLAAEVDKLPKIAQFAAELVGEYRGALSSEHGDGRCRSWLNEAFFGKELYQLYRQVKYLFDPQNLLNPGNIVDAGPMTENLRYGASYQTVEISSQLDFRADQGFARAVEMCNGAAVCRKLTAGVMCPSFMAVREEEHSTRGRANALRAALSGTLPEQEFTSKRMYQVMDLCIECKACKAECPSSVDMAKIKFEFLIHYYREHGVPLRTRLFAATPVLSRFGAGPAAPFLNLLLGAAPVKWGMEKFLGISRERNLPRFARQPFTQWFARRRKEQIPKGTAGQVVLFHDTFNTYNDPHISIAAVELLEALGYEVLLPGRFCCGRPAISKGLLEPARAAADKTLAAFRPFAEAGIPIVGLEPGCLLSLRDDYRYLLPDDPRVETVAGQSLLIEEFLTRLPGEQKELLQKQMKPPAAELLLHGHCHQKSLVGTAPMLQILQWTGAAVSEVDSGCCGMAGAFGYEAEHLAISKTMAERRLLPAVREVAPGGLIVAPGTSCRSQIADLAGKRAYHPVEVLRMALK